VLVLLLAGALLREPQQLLVRNQDAPSDAHCPKQLLPNELMNGAFGNAEDLSGLLLVIKQGLNFH